jgi:hypothetical protein
MNQVELLQNPEPEDEHSYPPDVRLVRVELLPGGLMQWCLAPENDEVES